MQSPTWRVHKFGGTSVADAARIRRAVALLAAEPPPEAVVVSAMAGVTDALLATVEGARVQNPRYKEALDGVVARYLEAANTLLPREARDRYVESVQAEAADLGDVLRGVWLTRAASTSTVDLVAGHGELWSAALFAAVWTGDTAPVWLDAREVLTVEQGETGPAVQWETSARQLRGWLGSRALPRLTITGFVASDASGLPTTLRRNGSDFSASIFARLLDAEAITIWTDVDGVLSADPRRVPEAVLLPELSYNEAVELAYFGAAVLHPHTMAPAIAGNIPIRIRNTFHPEAPGTLIHAAGAERGTGTARDAVKGFTSIEDVALVNVEGTGMIGVPGVAHRLFGSLREVGVSVIMISQASSEHSICFVVPGADADRARAAVERAFHAERAAGQVQNISVERPSSIVAAVGDRMVETPGVAARFFGALGKAGVNVRAVAQGSSERNISVVVSGAESQRALRAVHAGFYLSDQTLSVAVIGPGLVGAEFRRQPQAESDTLRRRFAIDLRVRGIARSGHMLLSDAGIPLDGWSADLESDAIPTDLDAFAAHLQTPHIPHTVIVDCTASEAVAARTGDWLARGIHVITPNKRANSGSLARYRELRALGRRVNAHYFYETTVGAGLPIIGTLRELVRTGDRVLHIEGVLSGTLSYLFNTYDGSVPFSALVTDARAKGYTEPDPRDDLSGMDVARKTVILARELGLSLELADIPVESLVPPGLDSLDSAEAFLDALPQGDAAMKARLDAARSSGCALRYVARIEGDGAARVELRTVPHAHPLARLTGTDNLIAFTTRRYQSQPLVVQGPGAGPEVTAAGVFADLLRLAAYLGAPS